MPCGLGGRDRRGQLAATPCHPRTALGVAAAVRGLAEETLHDVERGFAQPRVAADGAQCRDADEPDTMRSAGLGRDGAPAAAQRQRGEADAHLPTPGEQAAPDRLEQLRRLGLRVRRLCLAHLGAPLRL
jgi:hypothetical protein